LATAHPDLRLATPTQPRSASDALDAAELRCVRVGGARFAAVTEQATVEEIVDSASARRGHWTITANADHLRRYRREPLARELIDEADLVVADGMPLIWASRIAGTALPERVAGSSMIWSICEQACLRKQSIFLLGGDPGVAQRAAQVLCERYPGIRLAGTSCPPFGFENDDVELDRIQHAVVAAAPQIVFVALGFPKQDVLIRRLRCSLPEAVFIGVGISLSFVAGEISRAPGWMCKLGFEWLYRLLQEPRRLAHRYLIVGLPFVSRLLAGAFLYRIGRISTKIESCEWGWVIRGSTTARAFPTGPTGTEDRPMDLALGSTDSLRRTSYSDTLAGRHGSPGRRAAPQ
jgi:N-acetylglucosaminyldiphosphoundecaprenol N-acetyl-beta-D-mannosaminyltransferase